MSLPPANSASARPARNTRAALGFFLVAAAILLLGWWAFIRPETPPKGNVKPSSAGAETR